MSINGRLKTPRRLFSIGGIITKDTEKRF